MDGLLDDDVVGGKEVGDRDEELFETASGWGLDKGSALLGFHGGGKEANQALVRFMVEDDARTWRRSPPRLVGEGAGREQQLVGLIVEEEFGDGATLLVDGDLGSVCRTGLTESVPVEASNLLLVWEGIAHDLVGFEPVV